MSGALVVLIGLPLSALAQETSFTVDLSDLVPGVPQEAINSVDLERPARLRDFTWQSRTGILEGATMTVEICAPGGSCVDAEAPGNTIFPAGTVEVIVTAVIPDTAPSGGSGSAAARLIFVGADEVDTDDPLPFTGVEISRFVAWAAALISVGWLLLVIARRRREEEETR